MIEYLTSTGSFSREHIEIILQRMYASYKPPSFRKNFIDRWISMPISILCAHLIAALLG